MKHPPRVGRTPLPMQLRMQLSAQTTGATNVTPSDESKQTQRSSETWPAEGSSAYYALRHCSDTDIDRLRRTLTLSNSIGQCLLEVKDPTVAEKKIHWWHEELERLFKSEPRHPAAQGYKPVFQTLPTAARQLAGQCLLAVLSCHSEERFKNAVSDDEFQQRLIRSYRARLALVSLACSDRQTTDAHDKSVFAIKPPASKPTTTDSIDPLATGLALTHRLANFHSLFYAGMPVWPDNLYDTYQLTPDQFSRDHPGDAQMAMQNHIIGQAMENLQQAERLLQTPQQQNLQGQSAHLPLPGLEDSSLQHITSSKDANQALVVYVANRLGQLALWRDKKTNLLEHYRSLTPIRKAWISWRTTRRFNQNMS